jgi:CRP-like cAMP-binding protein
MELDDAATILAEADFFSVCDAEQRRLLAFASERKRFKPGAHLYKSGDVSDGAHILISGTIATVHDGAGDKPLVVNARGALLGAVALVVSKPRTVTVTAVDGVETLFVPRTAFMKLAQQYPDLAARAAQRIRAELSNYLTSIEGMRGRIRRT